MSNRIENISEFIDVSLDELANADIKFIKGIKSYIQSSELRKKYNRR